MTAGTAGPAGGGDSDDQDRENDRSSILPPNVAPLGDIVDWLETTLDSHTSFERTQE